MKWIKRLAYLVGSLYILACVVLYFQQERIIFHPDVLAQNFQFRSGKEIRISVTDELDLHAMWLRENGSRGVIMYWHGNKGSNRRCLRQADNLAGLGYDVFMPDYRGFGKSGGEINSQKQLFTDAQVAYDWLKQHYREDQIIICGYSLGSGVASYLAVNNDPEHLFLVAPYRSMVAMKNRLFPVVPSFLIKYPLRNERYVPQVTAPITLLHGTADELIPFEHSEYLQQLSPDKIKLIPLNGVSHRGSIFSSVLRRELASVVE